MENKFFYFNVVRENVIFCEDGLYTACRSQNGEWEYLHLGLQQYKPISNLPYGDKFEEMYKNLKK